MASSHSSSPTGVHIAFVRGINVGGSGMVSMPELSRIASECGFEDVRTYLRSGNLVLDPATRQPAETERALTAALAEHGHPARVFVRTVEELAAVVAECPFRDRVEDPTKVHVIFHDEAPYAPIDAEAFAPEEAVDAGRHTYLWLPGGIGRSRLGAACARRDADRSTTRNWRTVTAVLALAQADR